MKRRNSAIFLDRDGTIITERGYLSDPKKMKFYPKAIKALASLKKRGYKLVIISNQSGVARGYFTLAKLREIHRVFSKTLTKNGATLSGIYFCPHMPDAGCACRKPKTALLKKAARELKINLKDSYMVGDHHRDVLMAHRAGVKGVLVLTGHGRATRAEAQSVATKISSRLSTAARWILQQ